ncbi:MAG: DnaB-like helicase C-terminal domain-containing protein, partial [Ignavibacteriaceae bacterium]
YFAKKRELPLYISDKPMSELEIRNKAKYWKDRFGVKVIAVDYMGYIRSKRKFDLREREMSYYSEFLKSLAKELDITVIALAQLNRTGRQNPGTENLAESIALARDCDFLFVVYNILESGIDPGNSLSFTESDFMLKLDTTRHTKSKKQIQIRLNEDGIFEEIATEYDNNYVEKYSKKQKTKPEPNYNHYEHQYR